MVDHHSFQKVFTYSVPFCPHFFSRGTVVYMLGFEASLKGRAVKARDSKPAERQHTPWMRQRKSRNRFQYQHNVFLTLYCRLRHLYLSDFILDLTHAMNAELQTLCPMPHRFVLCMPIGYFGAEMLANMFVVCLDS